MGTEPYYKKNKKNKCVWDILKLSDSKLAKYVKIEPNLEGNFH